ncbi:MAG: hypothetical protein LDL51_05585 [Chloroflexi bacterium]|nr:hypothetical protein [Chloroflexota bacterium]
MLPKKDKRAVVISFLLIALSVILRASCLGQTNYDMTEYNLRWYRALAEEGIAKTLATNFTNYNPPYTYFLALATLTKNFLPPLVAIKLIPTSFDLFGAFLVYRLTRLRREKSVSMLAAAVYFSAPTVMLNSSYWGQADSIYTAMLLASLYLILKEKPASAMAAFGLSLATKAQAVFFAPFLAILFLQKRIRWTYGLVVPVAYLLAALPVVALGRPLSDTLLVYFNQANMVEKLSANAPNLYYLFPYDVYERVLPFGLLTAVVLISLWIISSTKNAKLFDAKNLVLYAFLSTALTPFLLPKMHDRYFYPADVFSIALAFHDPRFWFAPIVYQLISTASISVFLFNASVDVVVFAGLINSLVVAYLLREQWKGEASKVTAPPASSIFSWLIAILTPLVILGISARTAFTPLYFRIEYNVQNILKEPLVLSKYDLIVKSSNSIKYLTTDREIGFLTRLRLSNGEKMFSEEEYPILQNAKKELREVYFYWLTCALILYVAGLFAWSKNWLALFLSGVKKGARIAVGAGLLFLPGALFALTKTPNIFLLQLFSIRVWQGVVVAISLLTLLLGLFILLLIKPAPTKAQAANGGI